jgi:sugar O-acyltransferase (sialic acid O-acetyltransferase NeuD family)
MPRHAIMRKPIAIIGCGGHAKVVAAALVASGREVIAATSLNPSSGGSKGMGMQVMDDAALQRTYSPDQIELVLGIGSILPLALDCPTRRVIQSFRNLGYRFVGFSHPAAWIAPDTIMEGSVQIHAGAIVQPGVSLGEFTIINTRASVDHDCDVGPFCHIGPGATLSGSVQVGEGSHLGTGCSVIQGIQIGRGCFVAAGATVVSNLADGQYVRGVPAKPFDLHSAQSHT